MVVYHHTDMDGKSAAWIVHKMHPSGIEDHPEKYIMTNYGDKFDKHTEKDDVFIVDVSISDVSYEDFLNICKTARTVTWIDHHQSSLDIIEKHQEELQAIENLTYFVSKCASGAALTYCFFQLPVEDLKRIRDTNEDEFYSITATYHYSDLTIDHNGIISVVLLKENKKDPTDYIADTYNIKLPKWLFHVDDYDCWKGLDANSNYFSLGFDSEDSSIFIDERKNGSLQFNRFWGYLSETDTFYKNLIKNGEVIDKYIKSRYARELSSTFEWEYNGITFICKNAHGNSWNFGDLINKYPGTILFNYDGKSGMWEYSVYSNDNGINCKEFCESFGGGGHVHAAGFSTKELIFTNMPTKKENIIFLGGTWNEDPWREKFISIWNKTKDDKIKNIKLFDPIVPDWNEECKKKENEIKSKSILNLFVITPNQKGYFSFAEIADCIHYSKVYFAVLDEYNQFDKSTINSFNDIGELVESHGGKYRVYTGSDQMENIINDVISSL